MDRYEWKGGWNVNMRSVRDLGALTAAVLLAFGLSGISPAEAAYDEGYACTGSDNDFDQADCNADEVGLPIGTDNSDFIAKNENSDTLGTVDGINILSYDNTDGTATIRFQWITEFELDSIVVVEKADGWYDAYIWDWDFGGDSGAKDAMTEPLDINYAGADGDCLDGVDDCTRWLYDTSRTFDAGSMLYTWTGTIQRTGPFTNGPGTNTAGSSHLAIYGVVPIPAAVWLFGTAIAVLGGFGWRHKRAEAIAA